MAAIKFSPVWRGSSLHSPLSSPSTSKPTRRHMLGFLLHNSLESPCNTTVRNISNGGSVGIQHESFSGTIKQHNRTVRPSSKESKHFVLVSGLSTHLLGRARSRFCLIKAWLMNSAAAADGEIEGVKKKARLCRAPTPAHGDTWKVPSCFCLN